ncbi:MAG: glutamate--tRNA ligase, partial [Pseudomonadota bacterium]
AAKTMIDNGGAFRCYATTEEVDAEREAARAEGRAFRSPWRDRKDGDLNAPHVVRLRAPDDGRISFRDAVQGDVGVAAKDIDDLILLRTDGAPTYMLAVVVDDHEMGVTQIIRGDDHLANTYRQLPIYHALGWTPPAFAHVPLIHGDDGKKLSKRHGALGVEAYRDMGYLPEGVKNYLLRLGWSHGDAEIISEAQAIDWFDLDGLGKAAARLDFDKLGHVNAHYMAQTDTERLMALYLARNPDTTSGASARIKTAMPVLKTRAATLAELDVQAKFLLDLRPIEVPDKLRKKLDTEALERLTRLTIALEAETAWSETALNDVLTRFCEAEEVGMGKVGPPLRAVLTGGAPSPDIALVLAWLGRDEALGRISDQTAPVG